MSTQTPPNQPSPAPPNPQFQYGNLNMSNSSDPRLAAFLKAQQQAQAQAQAQAQGQSQGQGQGQGQMGGLLPPNFGLQQQQLPQQPQQQSSSVPGASGGRGDPGPSTMTQMMSGQQGQSPGAGAGAAGNFRPPMPQPQGGLPGGINPAQFAMLQQFSQAAQASGQGRQQWTPQQMNAAMQALQAQGGTSNPQALMAAMRAGQQGQGGAGGPGQQVQQGQQGQQGQRGQQGQQGQQGQARPPMGNLNMSQQMQGAQQQAQALQQARMQQLMAQQGTPISPDIARLQQQNAQGIPGRSASPASVGSPVRPPNQSPMMGNMPPPPIPGTQQPGAPQQPQQLQQQQQLLQQQQLQQQYQQQQQLQQQQLQQQQQQQQQQQPPMMNMQFPGQMQGMPSQPPRLMATPQQQQFIAQQSQQLMSSPQYQALPPAQQQAQLAMMQQRMLGMMMQAQAQQQPQSQPRQPQGMPQGMSPSAGMPGTPQGLMGQPQASPSLQRQQTPQQGMQMPGQQQQPFSSLPQHMAPPRPTSAASQRAPSPHPSQGGPTSVTGSPVVHSTPPPSGPSFPPSAPSPAHSNHSQHSQHPHTPQQMGPPPTAASPVSAGTPHVGQPPQGRMQAVNVNGQIPGMSPAQPSPYQQSVRPPQPAPTPPPQQANMGMPTIQQHVQAAQSMLQSGQLGGAGQGASMGMMPNMPPGALQNLTPQQQQQMATAMGFFTQAAQAQGQNAQSGQTPQPQPGAQQVRPGMPPMQPSTPGRPPMGMANINTSDFPFDWRLLPQIPFLNDARWRNDMQNRNPQLLAATQNAHATIQAGGVRADVLARMQQLVQMAARSHVQGAVRPPGTPQGGPPGTPQAGMPGFATVPPGQAQRMYPGLGQGTPTTPQSARPPPPHLAPGGADSPSTATMPTSSRRTSAGTKSKAARESATGQPNHAMPPPAWIPGHPAGPGAVRPPSEADGVHPPASATIAGPTPVSASKAIPVKEWEAALRLDLPITTITPLPVTEVDEAQDATFGGRLALLSEREKDDIKHWIAKDKAYASGIDDIKSRLKGKMVKWARGNDMETPWWSLRKGERYSRPAGRLKIVWPADKASQRARTTHRGRREIRFTPAQMKAMADVEDLVIPIRLDLDHDHYKLKDTFMWNCADTVVTPELFAQTLCDDFKVPAQHFVSLIVSAIHQRVREFQDQVLPLVVRDRDRTACKGKLDPEGDDDAKAMIEVFRRAREGSEEIKTEPDEGDGDGHVRIVGVDADEEMESDMGMGLEAERPMTVEEAMAECAKGPEGDDLRILIKVDIIVGTQNLSDTFEWDLNSSVSPEEFAASYTKELGLSGEFATAIAHDIHEQILVHKRSLFLVGHAPGSGYIHDDEVRSAFLPPLSTVLRREDVAMASFTPIFLTCTEEEIVVIEKERERDSKRKKRATRARRGITLPDREPVKTHRSLLNQMGPNGLLPTPVVETTPTVVAAAPTSRRAAAIAAQANINLMSQDLPIPAPPSPVPMPVSARGRKPHHGRGGRGNSRMSPTPGREGSVVNPDTPLTGMKRSMREESVSEAASPVPRKRHNNGRIESPPVVEEVKPPVSAADAVDDMIKTEPTKSSGGWHCKKCGVPEHLSGGVRKDSSGNKTMCATCSRYLTRYGKERTVKYNEDEEFHRLRLENGKRNKSDGGVQSIFSEDQPSMAGSTSPDKGSPSVGSLAPKPDEGKDDDKSESGSGSGSGSGSDSSSESSSDDDDDDSDAAPRRKKKQAARQQQQQQQQPQKKAMTPAPKTPGSQAVGMKSPAVNASPSTLAKKGVEVPEWISRVVAELKAKYLRDDFACVPKPRPEGGPPDWRMKCLDCPGKIYTLGPGETLQNFEVHLKNRAHIANRVAREQKGT